jgi:hypothetical protein
MAASIAAPSARIHANNLMRTMTLPFAKDKAGARE